MSGIHYSPAELAQMGFAGVGQSAMVSRRASTNIPRAPVRVGRRVIIGSGSVLLPGIDVGHGVAMGALSPVKGDCEPFGIHAETPARRVGERQRGLLTTEASFPASEVKRPA